MKNVMTFLSQKDGDGGHQPPIPPPGGGPLVAEKE